MTIYLVIHEDRHVDVAVYPHRTEAAAIAHAKEIANSYDDATDEQVAEWLFACRLSEESDYVHVVAAEMLP